MWGKAPKKPKNDQQLKEISLVEMMTEKSRSNSLLIRKDPKIK